MSRWLIFLFLLLSLLIASNGCQTGPSEACDLAAKKTCREDYKCVAGWCLHKSVEFDIAYTDAPQGDGGSK